ncbi:hypothetical protein [Streptomyces sp. NPDC058297]|uniref:hypothetical protein n=1 Tax=Streptomyces sp. NPDC058297 TaxID=3346433 RepID=UPI0036E7E362
MSALFDKFLIPIVVGLAVTGLAAAAGWLYRRGRTAPTQTPRILRRFILLRTEGDDGAPLQHETTQPPGTVITR